MQQIRTIRPELFKSSTLYDAEIRTRLPVMLGAAALLTVADSAGRFVWKPRQLAITMLPWHAANGLDAFALFIALESCGFVERYTVDGEEYGHVRNWTRYQLLPQQESASCLPPHPRETGEAPRLTTSASHAAAMAQLPLGDLPDDVRRAVALAFPLKGGGSWHAAVSDLLRWRKSFPAINVNRELTIAHSWLTDHAAKRKTARGMPAFIGNWLRRASKDAPAVKSAAVPMLDEFR